MNNITFLPADVTIIADQDESLLKAAMRAL